MVGYRGVDNSLKQERQTVVFSLYLPPDLKLGGIQQLHGPNFDQF